MDAPKVPAGVTAMATGTPVPKVPSGGFKGAGASPASAGASPASAGECQVPVQVLPVRVQVLPVRVSARGHAFRALMTLRCLAVHWT
jgi:hypothetical protein